MDDIVTIDFGICGGIHISRIWRMCISMGDGRKCWLFDAQTAGPLGHVRKQQKLLGCIVAACLGAFILGSIVLASLGSLSMAKICYVTKRFAPAGLAIITSANKIIVDYQAQGYRLTLRQLYYRFIAMDLFPATWIDEAYNRKNGLAVDTKNTVKNYKKLGGLDPRGRGGPCGPRLVAGSLGARSSWPGSVDAGFPALVVGGGLSGGE